MPYIVNFSDYYKLDNSFYERIKLDLIPYNWQEVKLGDVCTQITDGVHNTVRDNSNGDCFLLSCKNLKNGQIVIGENERKIDLETLQNLRKRTKTAKGDVLLSSVGTIGETAIIKENNPKYEFQRSVAIFKPNKTYITSEFLFYSLNNNKALLQHNAEGAVQQCLFINPLKEFMIPLPPLEVQKKIAGVLGALDDKIELNNKINQNLEAQAQALFKSWFVDFEPFGGKMPDDWKIGKFSDIITDTLGGDWGKETPQNNYTEEVSCIRGADIPDVKLGNKGKIPTRFILPKNYTNKKLIPGDLVIEISGGSPTQSTGRIAFISNHLLNRYNRKIICTNFCRAIKPMFGYSEYIYQYWQYLYDKDIFFTYENGTTGIKNLDLSGVLNTESIIIPNKSALMVFSEICNSYFDNIHFNGLEIEHLAELRDSLLPKLMSGEINVDNVKID